MFKKTRILIIILVLAACSSKPPQPTVAIPSSTPTKSTPLPPSATPTKSTPLPPRTTATHVLPRINATTSGTISQDETWHGEIHITGDIQMANGATLIIEPGTKVYLASNHDSQQLGVGFDDEYTRSHNDPVRLAEWDRNAILIDGRNGIIQAKGTSDQPITFRPEGDSTSPAQWYGIFIERGTLQHAIVLYGGRTAVQVLGNSDRVEIAYNEVRYFHWAGIDIHTSNAWVHHNIVEGGGHQGIGSAENALVENNLVTGAQTGISVERGNGTIVRNNIIVDCARGMELRDGENIEVINNTIARIGGPPDGWYYQGKLVYPAFENGGGIENYLTTPRIVVLNNIIYGPFDWGLGMHQQPGVGSVVDYNLVWNTQQLIGGQWIHFPGAKNIVADPLFMAPENGDFHLLPDSAAIDAGDPTILDPDGSPSDLGAYGGPQGEGW
jgi:parallel beta-helix repeat protein